MLHLIAKEGEQRQEEPHGSITVLLLMLQPASLAGRDDWLHQANTLACCFPSMRTGFQHASPALLLVARQLDLQDLHLGEGQGEESFRVPSL